jgi:Protein of unknown function (DUF1549)/Protein of unknown function (DUF1553)/Planctomycete cytochrome C
MRFPIFPLFLIAIHALSVLSADETAISDEELRYFERKIRPILVEHCYSCHSSQAKTLHGGLRLDSYQGVHQGGDSGPSIVAGKPEESLLVSSIEYSGDVQMPPKGKLPDSEIRELTDWIKRGAPFPKTENGNEPVHKSIDFDEGRKFWSFQTAVQQELPAVKNVAWPTSRMDHFILSRMEQEGLQPARSSDPAKLIRRLSFDLRGLPPTPEQVQAFESDPSPEAYRRLVDEFLMSPQYGEKWARMWLDLARYTDQTESWLLQEGQAHFYRDWVVNAFNQDMPYDEFVKRQLAVDLMPGTTPEDLTALGFVGLSPTYWKELQLPCEVIKVIVADEWEERVDAVSSTFLGLTVACARCHDHKFDPISSADFYAMAGVFASSRQVGRPLVPESLYAPVRTAKEEVAKLEPELTKLKAELTKLQEEKKKQAAAVKSTPEVQTAQQTTAEQPAGENTGSQPKESVDQEVSMQQKLSEMTAKISELKATPHYDAPLTNALSEESLYIERAGEKPENGTKLVYRPGPQDLPLFVRGDPNRPGEVVPRGFLTVLRKDSVNFQSGSGRLELANAITSDAASLAARVIVNRIWLAHFGQGIVSTPSNFGIQGGLPTHPQLLEDLAARFIANGWSIKWLHREILLSTTWRQSVEASAAAVATDPSNRWLSHFNRRRHDFEAWRDTMLTASGVLDLTQGGTSGNLDEAGNRRRTLYCTVHRRELSTTFQIHDFPDPNQHSPNRFATTTALQGLYALNGPLLMEQSQLLAARLEKEFPDDEAARIQRAHWLLFSRSASPAEQKLGLEYMGDSVGDARKVRWQQYSHALLASSEALFLD